MSEKWDRRFLELAKQVSTWSKDPSTKVGAVLVDQNLHVVGIGFNGFPSGVEDTAERWNNRELKYKLVVHAEVNAILQAGEKAEFGSLYVYPSFALPNICHDCAKFAIQSRIFEVVGYEPDPTDSRAERWGDSIKLSAEMFTEAGIGWRSVTNE